MLKLLKVMHNVYTIFSGLAVFIRKKVIIYIENPLYGEWLEQCPKEVDARMDNFFTANNC